MPKETHFLFVFFSAAMLASGAPECILDLEQSPKKGITQVWSPLFQAGWDKLQFMQKAKIEKVDPPNPLISRLAEFQWKEMEVMPAGAYALYAGPATPQFARATAHAIQKNFRIDFQPQETQNPPGSMAAYGVLVRNLRFEKNFFRARNSWLDFRDSNEALHKATYFGTAGTHTMEFGRYVKVLDYKDDGNSFVLAIATDRKDEKIIIFRPEQMVAFQPAIEHVKAMRKAGRDAGPEATSLQLLEDVQIPYIRIDARSDLADQLQGKIHYSGKHDPYIVGIASQNVRFELFEDGAKVRVETRSTLDPFGPALPKAPPRSPRKFICDRPFFVFLWRDKAEWPYLASWIDGQDCLTPFKP
jgi:hypothetical protein